MSASLPVSVIIPAFRRPDMVVRAVRSAQAQRPSPGEVLVVDDGSGDGTGERARALGARVVSHAENLGVSRARNSGMEIAEHEWIALLDCDDEWLPGHLETVWDAREGHVIVGSAVLARGERPAEDRVYGWTGRRPRLLRGPADVAVPENKLAPSAVLLRRDVALEVGGFRTGMPRAEDLDLWVRLLERGRGLALPQVTAIYHRHADQASGDAEPMWAAHRMVLERYATRPWCTSTLRRRHEGVVAWDRARAGLARGDAPAVALRRLGGQLVDPRRLWGLTELLFERHRARRRAGEVADRSRLVADGAGR